MSAMHLSYILKTHHCWVMQRWIGNSLLQTTAMVANIRNHPRGLGCGRGGTAMMTKKGPKSVPYPLEFKNSVAHRLTFWFTLQVSHFASTFPTDLLKPGPFQSRRRISWDIPDKPGRSVTLPPSLSSTQFSLSVSPLPSFSPSLRPWSLTLILPLSFCPLVSLHSVSQILHYFVTQSPLSCINFPFFISLFLQHITVVVISLRRIPSHCF